MSTFDGRVREFPEIRVDFFRSGPHLPRPLACFLSHVHSDHLAGLDTLLSPFVYCSAATRELLLRLEKYPCRINFAKGILETRQRTYKDKKHLLKPLPLQTPTVIELEPGNSIQVTLLDANHCPGSVMFLFEGHGKAVLYTGDTRCEPWFVNALVRNPCLVEYSSGIKTLDRIYLDTSFLDNVPFQTKAEGLRELLQKVSLYPPETIFHFQAWTFGYEEVWIALSKALGSKIHVDAYKMKLYQSLRTKDSDKRFGSHFHMSPEAPGLVGFMCGNAEHPGCLTDDESVRIHSCEKGNYCPTVRNSPVVRIQPIISHLPDGRDMVEVGIGGGGEDLNKEAELETITAEEAVAIMSMVVGADDMPIEVKCGIEGVILPALHLHRRLSLDLNIFSFEKETEAKIGDAIQSIVKRNRILWSPWTEPRREAAPLAPESLPSRIEFPYSRHSSYPELCHLVSELRPLDIWPCTVNEDEWQERDITIRSLFGGYCSGDTFQHDITMGRQPVEETVSFEDGTSQETTRPDFVVAFRDQRTIAVPESQQTDRNIDKMSILTLCDQSAQSAQSATGGRETTKRKRDLSDLDGLSTENNAFESSVEPDSQGSNTTEVAQERRVEAHNAMIYNARGISSRRRIRLISTTDNHTFPEVDLGSP